MVIPHSRSLLLIEVNVVRDATLVQELLELLVLDAVGAFDPAVQVWRPCARASTLALVAAAVPGRGERLVSKEAISSRQAMEMSLYRNTAETL